MIGFVLFTIAHLLIGLFAKEVVGLDITHSANDLDKWNLYWQTLHASDLQLYLLPSLWSLHGQPPLFNLYGAFFINLFPDGFMQALHYGNILLGALCCGLSYRTLEYITRSWWIAALGALLLTLNPALLIFEAYPLYTVLSLFFILLGLCFLARYQRYRVTRDLFGFMLAINLLVLTRSIFHPLFLLPCIALVVWLAGGQRWRVLRIALLISLLSFGWATKNYLQYGFWGTTSWTGLNLWRIVSDGYRHDQLEDFALAGVIDPLVVEKEAFTAPGFYVADGFNKEADLPSLVRDEYHNINIPEIARVYQRSALSLMRYDPEHYLTRVANAYQFYSCPSTRYAYTRPNAEKLGGLVRFFEDSIYGMNAWVARDISLWGQPGGCSMWYFGLPLSLIAAAVMALAVARFSPWRWRRLLHQEPVLLMMAYLIVFNSFVSVVAEINENVRFKFLIEPVWWLMVLALAYRLVQLVRGRGPAWDAPAPLPRPAASPPLPLVLPGPVPVSASVDEPVPAAQKRRLTPLLGLLLSVAAIGGVAVWWRQRKTLSR